MQSLGILCASLSRGGAERVAIYLAQFISTTGKTVYMITASKADEEYDLPEGLERIIIGDGSKSKKNYLHQIVAMRRVIKEKQIDTILIMGVPVCIYGIPGSMGTGANIYVSERNDPKNFAGKRVVKILSRIFMRYADGFIFQTNEARQYYKRMLHNRGIVIFNPLFSETLPKPYLGKREKVIVSVGRLIAQKNQILLIRAFANILCKFPDYKLIIYGEGVLREQLEREIKNLGVKDNVFLPGNKIDVCAQIRKAALFVLTSDFEGMPNSLIEAMALGIPSISTDCPCGGPREIIEDGVNGVLIPVGDRSKLEITMLKLLSDEKYRDSLSKNALLIRDRLDEKIIGNRWIDYMDR